MGHSCSMPTESMDAYAEVVSRSTGCDVVWPKMISMEPNFLTFLDVGSAQALSIYNQANRNILVDKVPAYTSEFTKSLGGLAQLPNAFGIGALILSMILELALNSAKKTPSTESILLRVFAKEKVSRVRDQMDTYIKRWKANISDKQRLIEETETYEKKLSEQLVVVLNSMLLDNQGSTRSVRVWMHGAAFHVHMDIYKEALRRTQGRPDANLDDAGKQRILSYIDDYIKESKDVLEKYKVFRKDSLSIDGPCARSRQCKPETLVIKEDEQRIEIKSSEFYREARDCEAELLDRYLEKMYARCPPPTAFSDFLLKTKNQLNSLLLQKGSFRIE